MLVSVDIQWIAMIRPRDKSITVGMCHGAALPNVPQLIFTESEFNTNRDKCQAVTFRGIFGHKTSPLSCSSVCY